MLKRPILSFSNEKPAQKRVFDIVIESNRVVRKNSKIHWDEVTPQMED